MTARPIFLLMVPDRKPRTECGCQPVASLSSVAVAPPGRLSRSRMIAVLLFFRARLAGFSPLAFFAPLDAFLAALAFFPDFGFFGATWAERAPTVAFFLPFGCSLSGAFAVSTASVLVIIVVSPCGSSAMTSIPPLRSNCKLILLFGDVNADQ